MILSLNIPQMFGYITISGRPRMNHQKYPGFPSHQIICGPPLPDYGLYNRYSSTNGWLVVYLPLWKICKSVGMIIPNAWKNEKCATSILEGKYFYFMTWGFQTQMGLPKWKPQVLRWENIFTSWHGASKMGLPRWKWRTVRWENNSPSWHGVA